MDNNLLEDFYGNPNTDWKEDVLEDTKYADQGFDTYHNGKEPFSGIDDAFKNQSYEWLSDFKKNTKVKETYKGSLSNDVDDNMHMNIVNFNNKDEDREFLEEYSNVNEFKNTTLISQIKEDPNENILPDIGSIKNHVPYDLFQETNKQTNFSESMKGIIEPTILSGVFFSRKNIDNLHTKIKVGIKRILNYDINNQSEEEIQIIMRSIYLQLSKNTDCDIQKQVTDLNKEVLNYCISNIYTNIKQYLGYIRNLSDVSDFVMPPPEETNIAGNKRGYRMDHLIDHAGNSGPN
jgi:hypothetical protein